jgi:hypothetical protein
MLDLIEMLPGKVPSDVRTIEQALEAEDRDRLLVVVDRQEVRARLVDGGLLPGNVVWIHDVMSHFRVLPRTTVPEARRAAS